MNKMDLLVQETFLKALLSGDKLVASKVVQDLLKSHESIDDIYEILIKQALYKVGDLWESGSISVATEHLASAIVQTILNEVYFSVVSQNKKGKTAVVACVENEQHEIGSKMVADIFEMYEWNTLFLGAGMPVHDLISFLKSTNPDLLALSAALKFNLPNMDSTIDAVRRELPDLLIVIGGHAFVDGGYDLFLKKSKVVYTNGLYELESLLSTKIQIQ